MVHKSKCLLSNQGRRGGWKRRKLTTNNEYSRRFPSDPFTEPIHSAETTNPSISFPFRSIHRSRCGTNGYPHLSQPVRYLVFSFMLPRIELARGLARPQTGRFKLVLDRRGWVVFNNTSSIRPSRIFSRFLDPLTHVFPLRSGFFWLRVAMVMTSSLHRCVESLSGRVRQPLASVPV